MSTAFVTINNRTKHLDLNFFPSKFTLPSISMKNMRQMASSNKMIALLYSKLHILFKGNQNHSSNDPKDPREKK